MTVRPVKTQICPVWSVFAVPHEETLGPKLPTECPVKTDQTGRMPRLIRVFAGHTVHFVGFVVRWLICGLDLQFGQK